MNKITEYKLDEVYEMASGISTSKEQAGKGAPFVSFGTVFNNYFLPEELPDLMDASAEEQETYSIKKDDVLITRTSETIDELAMSCVAIKDYPGATYSGFTKRLRPIKEGIVYSKYIAFYLRGYLFRRAVTNNAFMTLRASFNEDIFSFMKLYLPSYEQQKKIGDMLYAIERKIQINRKINDNLVHQLQTIYNYWFSQYDFPNNQGKPYKASKGTFVTNDAINSEVPVDWSVSKLNTLCSFKNGINYDKELSGNKSYRIVNVRNITATHTIIDETDCDEITLPSTQADKYILNDNDIIIARSGTPGATRLLINPSANTIFCGFIICCTPIQAKYREYFFCCLKQLEGTSATKTGGSILQNVSQDTLKELNIIVPPDSVLNKFNEIARQLINQMHVINCENQKLSSLRDFLLPLLMNGQASIFD